MNHLLQAFLANSVQRCQILRGILRRVENAESAFEKRDAVLEIFRQIHTLKGSAAAFELESVSLSAHDVEHLIENLLASQAFETNVLNECLAELENILKAAQRNESFESSAAKIGFRRAAFDVDNAGAHDNQKAGILPAEFLNRLSGHEQLRVQSAINQNADVLLFEAKLATAGFADSFRQLHAKISQYYEIVATLPDNSISSARKDTLRMHLVCVDAADDLQTRNSADGFVAPPNCRVVSILRCGELPETTNVETTVATPPCARLFDVWKTPLAAALRAARKSGKTVLFETSGGEIEVSSAQAETCQAILLHLLRNAVVHGIEARSARRRAGKAERGTILLEAISENGNLHLKISDDGGGINTRKILEIAIERGILERGKTFDQKFVEHLIFAPGFSTAASVTHEAGRGIGLDAVMSAVKNVGGELRMTSEDGRGTTFFIRLPAF